MHSISIDEVTSSNGEILPICVRYLGEFQNIREVFIGFLNLESITGEHIGEAILKFYRELRLRAKECKGQCMMKQQTCSQRRKAAQKMKKFLMENFFFCAVKGVASVVLRKAPDLIVTHCCSLTTSIFHLLHPVT